MPKYGDTMLIDIPTGFMQAKPHPVGQHFWAPEHWSSSRQLWTQTPGWPSLTLGQNQVSLPQQQIGKYFYIIIVVVVVIIVLVKAGLNWLNKREKKKMKEQRNEIHSITNPPDCS